MHEGEKINKRLCKFFIEIFEFTDKQLAAIDCQIPMTQEMMICFIGCYLSIRTFCLFMPRK